MENYFIKEIVGWLFILAISISLLYALKQIIIFAIIIYQTIKKVSK